MMLRMAREVAWLREGSCTDHVISAAAAPPASAIRPSPISSRSRRNSESRIEAGRWPTSGMTRSIAGMCPSASRLSQRCDQAMQRLGRRFTVRYQREPDKARTGIEAVVLLAREIAARDHAHACVAIEFDTRRFVATVLAHIEPDAEAARRALVAIAVTEDLVGEIELDAVELAVVHDMRLVAI